MSAFVVVGGAGRTGELITAALRSEGHSVVVAGRTAEGDSAVKFDLARVSGTAVFAGADGIVIVVEPPHDPEVAEAAMHRGVAALAAIAAREDIPVVLVSQIYLTRGTRHPDMAERIAARARGERALRESGAQYTIVRPSWLHNRPADGVRVEQGDTGDGRISREAVADAVVAALFDPSASGKTFELYDDADSGKPDWPTLFASLTPDPEH
jgi:uncharacterized protein YbjT (DUF2867 family)